MAHPFSKLFEKALVKSTHTSNLVLRKAEELREKGYAVQEISQVLEKLQKSLLSDVDAACVKEALEEFRERYMDEDL